MRCYRASGQDPVPTSLRVARQTTGYPNPSEDYAEASLDVRELLVHHPPATFFLRMASSSMRDAGIEVGDLLVVDRALDPIPGALIVAVIGGELLVRRLPHAASRMRGVPDAEMSGGADAAGEWVVWGVVTWVLHPCL